MQGVAAAAAGAQLKYFALHKLKSKVLFGLQPEPFWLPLSSSLLPAAHLFITVRICGEALTEILAFAVFGNKT